MEFYKHYGKNIFKNILVPLKFWGSLKLISLIIKYQINKFYLSKEEKFEILNFNNENIVISQNLGDIASFLEIFNLKEYSLIFELIKKDKIKPFTLIDLGANIGLTYIYFKNLNLIKNYIGVEPLKNNLKLLNFNTYSQNSNIIPKAVWVDNKGVFFTDNRSNNANFIDEKGTTKIETITLKEIFNSLKEEDIFLKVDIEGAEYKVIEKDLELISKKVKYIAIEYHDIKKNDYKKQIENLSKHFKILESIKENLGYSLVFGINKEI